MKVNLAFLAIGVGALGVLAVSAQDQQTQWDGVYTKAQAQRGGPLYEERCAACHGPNLLGGEMAPSLVGGEFTANWNELPLGDLFERIRVSMPQDDPGSLSRQENADILAYILQQGQYPAGEQELSTRTEYLNMYKFVAMKPAAP